MALRYQAHQFFAALNARVTPDERQCVATLLTAAELALFESMPVYDQRHCLDVFGTLRDAGYSDPLLLRAALFHDCGKVDERGNPMPLLWYVAVSLLKRIVPPVYRALAASGRGPLRPIRVYAEHAWRGSRLAAAAGSPTEIVTTIRHYHDVAPTGRAALLQWADEQH